MWRVKWPGTPSPCPLAALCPSPLHNTCRAHAQDPASRKRIECLCACACASTSSVPSSLPTEEGTVGAPVGHAERAHDTGHTRPVSLETRGRQTHVSLGTRDAQRLRSLCSCRVPKDM